MTATNILAIILAVIVLIKAVIFLPMKKYPKNMFKHKTWFGILSLILAVIVGIFLFKEMSIVQVAAAALFVFLVYGFTMTPFVNKFAGIGKDAVKHKGKFWFSFLIWIILAVIVLIAAL